MKHLILSAICVAALSACTSQPKTFGPAYGTDFGFRNTQLEQDRFRISYTSRDAYESRDFALLRAAQIATNEGYTHFKVVDASFYDNGPNLIGSQIGVGLGGGRHNRSHIGVGVADVERAIEGRKVTETIEVLLLSNPTTRDPDTFSAQSIMRNIVPPQPYPANPQPAQPQTTQPQATQPQATQPQVTP